MTDRIKKYFLVLAVLLLVNGSGTASTDENPFICVFIDHKTEQVLGPFPYDRKIYAQAVQVLIEYKARAVVMKYFLDQPKNSKGDQLLAQTFYKIPSFLQARMIREDKPNPLSGRFIYTNIAGKVTSIIEGQSGWIPLKIFSDNCYDLGFVDIKTAGNNDLIPVIEKYQGNIYRSLYLSVLEYIFGRSEIEAGKSLKINNKVLALEQNNEVRINYPEKDTLEYISFIDLINQKADHSRLENKIIILGYDGDKIDTIKIKTGNIRSHRVFYYILQDLYNRIR